MSDPATPEKSKAAEKTDSDPLCETRLAADAVRLAKAELQKAQAAYEQACRQATARLKAIRETNLGAVLDKTLDAVKHHPGAGVTIAGLIGFCLGRLFGPKR
jgi:ElaB/YqjD/DUF883 family membrane-anchored ribosome-binding protein